VWTATRLAGCWSTVLVLVLVSETALGDRAGPLLQRMWPWPDGRCGPIRAPPSLSALVASAEAGTNSTAHVLQPLPCGCVSVQPRSRSACEPAILLLRAARRHAAMSTMITFAANNEFFRKRKRNAPPVLLCATQVANGLHRRPPRMRLVQETTRKQPSAARGPVAAL
jgi:hypothetical protein